EVFVLVSALEEQVVGDLLAGLGSQSWALVAARLTRRLVEHRALENEAALWSVESWALALRVITEAELTPGPQSRHIPGPTGGPSGVIATRIGRIQERRAVERPADRPPPDLITTRVW